VLTLYTSLDWLSYWRIINSLLCSLTVLSVNNNMSTTDRRSRANIFTSSIDFNV